jgi:hypothetical protein
MCDSVTKFDVGFFGEVVKMQKVDTVLWLGSKFAAHQSLEAWEFQNSKLLVGPSA